MKKKVVFFIKSLGIGGTERVLISYLRGLSESNKYNVELIINRNGKTNILLNDVPKNIKVKYIFSEKFDTFLEKISVERKKNIIFRIIYSILMPLSKKYREKKIQNLVIEEKIDVLVDFERSFIKIAEKIKCKKILWNHFTFNGLNNMEREKWNTYLDKYDSIVAISNEMLDEIKKIYSKEEKLFMLYNPQSFDKIIKGSILEEELLEEEKLLLNDNYIVYVGRIEKIKKLEDLIESYKKIENKIKEKLYIIGTGNEVENLKKIVKKFQLEKKILFLGNKPNPYIWMKNAELFVTTTYGEGLPTTYIESMISGTPVLSYDSPTGPKDILGMGKYGALVKKGEIENFSIEMEKLLNNKELIEEYRGNMSEKLEQFKIENITKKFELMIESI